METLEVNKCSRTKSRVRTAAGSTSTQVGRRREVNIPLPKVRLIAGNRTPTMLWGKILYMYTYVIGGEALT